MDRDDEELDDRTDPLGRKILSSRPRHPRGLERRVGLNKLFSAVLGGERNEARFGRFVIDRKHCEGGMGQLFRGFDPDSGRPVAIKVGLPTDQEDMARLRREATRLRELVHPRIVRYLADGSTDEGCHFLVMEWLDGSDVARRLRRRGPLDSVSVRHLAVGIAEGLAVAHRAGVVHRDVKPSNVFMVDDDPRRVRLLDFGIARTQSGEDTPVTATGVLVGTPSCMAPEQVEGEWTELSDVYGLGGTLFEALTGEPLFRGDTPTDVVIAVLSQPAPRVHALVPDVDPRLDDLVHRMVDKDPAARPQGMQAVLAELAAL